MKPISLIIRDTQTAIVKAINESQLPPSILLQIIAPIKTQVERAALEELEQAEKEYSEQGGEGNAESN